MTSGTSATPACTKLTNVRRILALALAAHILLAAPSAAQGPRPPVTPLPAAPAEPAKPPTAREMTAQDVEAFLDGIVPALLARENIAGAVISVVRDGRLLFAKGYGFADVEKRTPVSAERTLFRPGSVSKLFTWTAVMQQVEQGKLDLDRDVNSYLDFTIPATFPQPITLRHLMTHTPGFEEAIQELFVADASRLAPLGDYLRAHLPKRVFPPGTTPAYSNYGTALAAYIVQRVSGVPFDRYIEEHVFGPLDMRHTTFRQPLPANLAPLMSSGYQVASEKSKPFELVNAAPAGSVSASATDMARFMIAHLQDGRLGSARILRPETARLMHSNQFTSVSGMNAMALGFYETSRNGQRIISHGGDTQFFHSNLHLLPDAGVGFFISYNSAGRPGGNLRAAIWESVLDRYFPYTPPAVKSVPTAAEDVRGVAGPYLVSRRGHTTIMKVLAVAGGTKVGAGADGTLTVDGLQDFGGQPKKFEEVAPRMFREVHGQERVAFKRDESGRLVMAVDYPFMVFHKARWYESSTVHVPMILGAIAVFVLTLLLWPIGAIVRRHYGRRLNLEPADRRLRLAVRLVCAINILFLLGFVVFFTFAMKDIGMLSARYNPLLRVIQVVGWLGIAGTLVAVYYAFRSWTTPGRWIWSKLADSVVALACLASAWFVLAWNMLHLSLQY